MTLRFIEGFDDSGVASDLNKWDQKDSNTTGSDIDVSFGRTDKGCRIDTNNSNALIKDVPAAATYVVGLAVLYGPGGTLASNTDNMSFREGTTTHVSIRYDGVLNRINVYRGSGGTLLGSSANGSFTRNIWHYVEAKVTVHDTTGAVEIRVDGVTVLNLTNQDTRNGATGIIDRVGFGANSGTTGQQYIDDIYMLDTSGSINNDFLGEVRVQTIFPDADDTNEDWTLSAGSDSFALVDEDPPNGDTDYIESDTAAEITDLGFEDLTDNGQTIYGIQTAVVTRRDSVATRNVRSRVLSNASVDNGVDHTPVNGTYQMFLDVFEQDPDGPSAWDQTALNAAAIGVEARD